MRALKSGRIKAASLRLRSACVLARLRTAMRNSSASRTFSFSGETASVPARSGRKSSSVCAPIRAAAIPASEISKAMAGGGSSKSDLSWSNIAFPLLPFDERHFVDFPQGYYHLAGNPQSDVHRSERAEKQY